MFFLIITAAAIVNSGAISNFGLTGRIVNGTEANIHDHPYQISIQYDKRHCCGGVLISSKHILTVGHCLKRRPIPSMLKIRLGTRKWKKNGIIVRVKSYKIHPDFFDETLNMDVALVELKHKVFLNNQTIRTIQIASETPKNGTEVIASGWGITQSDEIEFQDNLREVRLRIMSRELCAPFYENYQIRIKRSMICANAVNKDVCFGDSGGPLVASTSGQLVGIVSWGFGCANITCPGVYTDVTYIKDWIEANSK